jgi:L-aminopeptidase/D-esterase-like protein
METTAMPPGPRNAITDVPGLWVGNAEDNRAWSGVTVVLPEQPAVASVDARGGGTGSRDIELLRPEGTIEQVHAIVLSGGSAFGLDAAGGTMSWLAERGRGFSIASTVVPIVPQAILFDLANGGDKDWGPEPPYWSLGHQAIDGAGKDFRLGNAGAGLGAKAGALKGGLGTASMVIEELDITVGALAAVNCVGDTLLPDTGCFFAWDMEIAGEFGGRRPTDGFDTGAVRLPKQIGAGGNTTIAVVACDAVLSKTQARRLAIMAQDGLARAIRPAHTPLDGDTVFTLAIGHKTLKDPVRDLALLGGHAANCLARAIARGVYEAESLGEMVCYRDMHKIDPSVD